MILLHEKWQKLLSSSVTGNMVLVLVLSMLAFDVYCTQAFLENGNKIKSRTFLSPEFIMGPGSVESKTYYDIDFPRGHIALKSFNAEVVDQAGNPVPLFETYFHHWLVGKYYEHRPSDRNFTRNSGLCQGQILGQYFGLGSETRKTATDIPDPFGIEIGNPAEIPEGYQEKWYLDVHAIETRGVEDRLGCIECRCDLYNVTNDEDGNPIKPDYKGGLQCCYGETRCKLSRGFQGGKRSISLRYTVKWIDWDSSVIPVEIFTLDVTDTGKRLHGSTGISPENGCQVEYAVESCTATNAAGNGCVDIKRNNLTMPTGGYVIYAVAHQHVGGIGSTLYGQDGNIICTSKPIYGNGNEAGNEDGYIVGMSTCYPEPGSVKITAGENLTLESNYNSTNNHTGVMGLFYLHIAKQAPNMTFSHPPVQMHESIKGTTYAWSIVVFIGLAVTIAVAVRSWLKKRREGGYNPVPK
ncbi:Stress up-regulated Nod [Salix suchowensis]|uniref:STRESS UP-REGULATED NOD 19 PROTEIN n=2 Tax=Salix koriyanagi TaxID=2511006 RepID=A0A9Q0ST47_9ROSI|nr:Stress up-regulated Nod [Salix suchowensis]KAJ6688488.1 STRESS UP-REGULATED NOD 19 PROTEIN [Salix koriyanagi]